MDVSHLLDSLNDRQREAVAAPMGSALVLAGAGSGKTRVLVHRIAWLIQTEGLSPFSILAVTGGSEAGMERARDFAAWIYEDYYPLLNKTTANTYPSFDARAFSPICLERRRQRKESHWKQKKHHGYSSGS